MASDACRSFILDLVCDVRIDAMDVGQRGASSMPRYALAGLDPGHRSRRAEPRQRLATPARDRA